MNIKTKRRRKQIIMKVRRVFVIIILLVVLFYVFLNKSVREQIFIDNTIPEIILKGETNMTLLVGDLYEEPGYSAIDNGQDLTARVETSDIPDTNTPGSYTINYSVTDDYGNSSTVSRQIVVEKSYTFETNDVDFYIRTLENYLKKKGYDLSIGYKNLENDYIYKYNSDESYYGASTIKPVAALYAYENLNLTGSIKNLVEPMISVSDNEAYVSLADIIGVKNLKLYGENLGLTDFMTDPTNQYYSDTTVDNQLIIWQKLWDYFNMEDDGIELQSYFDNDDYNYLKYDDDLKVLHKYGEWETVFHDTGIIETDSPYIIIVLTNEGYGNYKKIINDVSEKIYGLNELVKKQ